MPRMSSIARSSSIRSDRSRWAGASAGSSTAAGRTVCVAICAVTLSFAGRKRDLRPSPRATARDLRSTAHTGHASQLRGYPTPDPPNGRVASRSSDDHASAREYPGPMERVWAARLRWRLRGAWLAPLLAVLTAADGALLHALPLAGDRTGVAGGLLLGA